MTTSAFFPRRAFILAAGRGTRMRPHTDHKPKPMVEVNERSLIYRILDHLCAAEVDDVTVNLHHLGDMLREHLEDYKPPGGYVMSRVHFSAEEVLLDTGGGVKNALQHFGSEPFYVIAGDGLWSDGKQLSALQHLAQGWNPGIMDILILLQPVSNMKLTGGLGDYDLLPDGRAMRSLNKSGSYMWTNIRINRPEIYVDAPDGAFSFLDLLDKAEKEGRLYGLIHDGEWHHVSTSEDLARVDRFYRESKL